MSRNMQKLYSWESLARKAAWEQSASLATAQTPTSKYLPDSRIMSRLVCTVHQCDTSEYEGAQCVHCQEGS